MSVTSGTAPCLGVTACPLFMEGEELEQVERFTYLGSCISINGNITSEITARISKA